MTATPDIAPTQPPAGALSVSDLARRLGLKKQTVSDRLKGYEARRLIRTWPGPGRAKLVDPADWDRLTASATDQAKLVGAATTKAQAGLPLGPLTASEAPAPGSGPEPTGYAAEQHREKSAKADLAELERDREFGKVLPVELVTAAMVRCAEVLVRRIDQLPGRADDLAAAVAKDGTHGARVFLKACAVELRQLLADEMKVLEASGREDEGESEEGA